MLTQARSTPACWSRWITFAGWLLSLAVHAAYPDAVLTDRPTGYWKLTDLNSVTAVANAGSSSAGFAGQRSGSVQLGAPGLTTDTAAAFDGSPAQFAVPFNLAHNRYLFSVEAWVRLPSLPNVDRCVLSSIDLGATGGYQLVVTASGKWQFLTGRNGLGGDWEALEVPATTATSWTHLVAEYDGTNKLFYVNGLLVAAARSPYFPNPTRPLRLGADTSGLRPFLGTLAHVAVYDRPLTAGAIGRHFTAGTGLSPSTTALPQILVLPQQPSPVVAGATVTLSVVAGGSAPLTYQWRKDGVSISGATTPVLTLANFQAAQQGIYNVTVKNALGAQSSPGITLGLATYSEVIQSDHPLAYWSLGETNRSTVVHDGALGLPAHLPYNGVPSGTVGWEVPGIVDPKNSWGARFSWSTYSKIDIANPGVFSSHEFTIECWARLNGGSGGFRSPLTMRETSPALAGFMFYAEPADHWEFWTGKGDNTSWDTLTGPLARMGQWDHLAATYDGVTKRFYVNGQLVGSSITPYSGGNSPLLRLGAGETEGPGSYYFEGDLDEVAFYHNALSPERIAAHAAAGRPALDTTPPRIMVPTQTRFPATGSYGANVSLDVTAYDANDGPVPVTLNPPIALNTPVRFPLGDTLITATAHDAAGNINTVISTVTIFDNAPPIIQHPASLYLEATRPEGALLDMPFAAVDVVDGPIAVISDPPAGTLLPMGTSSVVLSARDRSGNFATTTYLLQVRDTERPNIQLPENITVEATSDSGAYVDFVATATDAGSRSVSLTYSAQSGSFFHVGTTPVYVTATDESQNRTFGTFQVTVRPPRLTISPETQSITVGEGAVVRASGTFTTSIDPTYVDIRSSRGIVSRDNAARTWAWEWTVGNNSLSPSVERVYASILSLQTFANLSVTITNRPPVALDGIYQTILPGTLWSTQLQADDPGRDPVSFRMVTPPKASKGTARMFLSGILEFTPAADFRGVATVDFIATDSEGASSAPARVILLNGELDAAPLATPASVTVPTDTSTAITLTGSDADADDLTYVLGVLPSHGTITGTPPQLTYTPSAGYVGSDRFSFQTYDGYRYSFSATVSIQVQGAFQPGTRSFTNSTPIVIGPVGPASPYGTPIQVAGLGGKISRVTVQLRGFSHTLPDDVDMLLVGPTGRKAIIFSDVGGTTPVSGIDLALADAATVALPDATPLTSGTFKPLNYGTGDSFNAPAPVGPYLAALNQFNNGIPNGTWTLYVMDDAANNSGVLAGGWSLTITTVAGVGVASVDELAPALTLRPESLRSSPRLRIDGAQPGRAYVLEASRDLEVWTPRWQGLATDTAFEVDAGPEADAAAGFFRLRRVDAEAE